MFIIHSSACIHSAACSRPRQCYRYNTQLQPGEHRNPNSSI